MDKPGKQDTPFLPDWTQSADEGLESILKRHLRWIQAHVSDRLGDFRRSKSDTGDIVQEAMVQFLKNGPRIRLSNDNQLRVLLLRIVENVICDKYAWFTAQRRAMSKERPLPPDTVLNLNLPTGTQDTPSQIAQRHEDEAWARLGLELIEPDDREILILHYWENQSFKEIGEALGLSKSAANKRYIFALYRLIEKVRALQSGRIDEALERDSAGESSM